MKDIPTSRYVRSSSATRQDVISWALQTLSERHSPRKSLFGTRDTLGLYAPAHNTNGSVWGVLRPEGGGNARQASGAFDAGEKSTDEDSIEAEMNESSEHFLTVHGEVRDERASRV